MSKAKSSMQPSFSSTIGQPSKPAFPPANGPIKKSSSTSGATSIVSAAQAALINVNGAKKKRTALENISNATGSTSMMNGQMQINKPDASKKPRVNSIGGLSVHSCNNTNQMAATCLNQISAGAKKVEAVALPKKPATFTRAMMSSSKENLNIVVPSMNGKKVTSTTTTTARVSVQSKTTLNKESKKVSTDLNIVSQLATTTISSVKTVAEECMELLAEDIKGWDEIDVEFGDEFSANDYVAYIFKYYRERESKFAIDDYMKRQPHLNKQMRLLLVDWMVEVQQQLEFNHEVLYLSVKLLDLYLSQRKIEKEKLQLLGGAAMFIACKFEERMPPIIDDFIYVSDNAYDRNELIKMEIDILKTVRFDIGCPLSYTFLRRYSKCVKADMKFLTLARYILELSLQDYQFAYVGDSIKACGALYLALKMTVAHENSMKDTEDVPTVSSANLTATEWNATLIHYTGSFLKDFIVHLPALNNLIKAAPVCKYKTIHEKYSHQVFYQVAKIPPLSDEELTRLANECVLSHEKLVRDNQPQSSRV